MFPLIVMADGWTYKTDLGDGQWLIQKIETKTIEGQSQEDIVEIRQVTEESLEGEIANAEARIVELEAEKTELEVQKAFILAP